MLVVVAKKSFLLLNEDKQLVKELTVLMSLAK